MDQDAIIEETRRWIRSIVIGLDLCPFAGRVFREGRIRYVVTAARDHKGLLAALADELLALNCAPMAEVETTLLIHPQALADFLEYNNFLGDVEELVDELGLSGVIQVASFHPGYQFEGTDLLAVENYTNRSPYPMLHLLREESISKIADAPESLHDIPRRNIETLRALGREKIFEMLKAVSKR